MHMEIGDAGRMMEHCSVASLIEQMRLKADLLRLLRRKEGVVVVVVVAEELQGLATWRPQVQHFRCWVVDDCDPFNLSPLGIDYWSLFIRNKQLDRRFVRRKKNKNELMWPS